MYNLGLQIPCWSHVSGPWQDANEDAGCAAAGTDEVCAAGAGVGCAAGVVATEDPGLSDAGTATDPDGSPVGTEEGESGAEDPGDEAACPPDVATDAWSEMDALPVPPESADESMHVPAKKGKCPGGTKWPPVFSKLASFWSEFSAGSHIELVCRESLLVESRVLLSPKCRWI